MKFKEAVEKQILAEHKLVVVDHLIKHIGEYLPQEVGDPKELVDRTCIQPVVSANAFYSVMDDLCTLREIMSTEMEGREESDIDIE